MYCKQCGKELNDGDKICKHCMTALNAKDVFQDTHTGENTPDIGNKPVKKYLGIGAIVLVVLLVIGIIFVNQIEKINVEDIVMASFYGYDTVGEGSFYIDEEKIPVELWNTISLTPGYAGFLTNGEEIDVAVSYDNSIAREYGIEFVGEKVTFTVSGLTELVEVDPFDGFTLNIGGISPYGSVAFTYDGNNEHISTENFYIENKDFIKNGDTVTVEYRSALDITKYGYKVTEYEKEYLVEGLDEYVDSFSQLSETFVTELKNDASDVITSYTSSNYSQFTAKSALEYVGYVYSVRKELDGGSYNDVYIIYRSYLSCELNTFEEQYIYYPVKYTNIIFSNGAFSADRVGIEGYTQEEYDTKGYRIPSKAYNDIVTEKDRIYNVTVGGGFENYAHNGYVYSVSEINDVVMQVLEERALARVKKYLNESDDFKWYTVSEPVKIGGYFLVSKNQSGLSNASNKLILVYSSVVSHSEEGDQILYLPVIYKNVQIYPNGDFTYEDRYLTDEHRGINYWLGNHTQGFIDESMMYSLLVSKYVDKYEEEVFGDLKTY